MERLSTWPAAAALALDKTERIRRSHGAGGTSVCVLAASVRTRFVCDTSSRGTGCDGQRSNDRKNNCNAPHPRLFAQVRFRPSGPPPARRLRHRNTRPKRTPTLRTQPARPGSRDGCCQRPGGAALALFPAMGGRRQLRGFGGEIAIDLGTANTVVYVRGQGIVLFEPSVIAIDERSGNVLAVGAEAKRMIGRTPATISATRPLRHGVIADFDVTEQMLRHFMRRAIGSRLARPRVILCVPSGLTPLERDAVEEAARAAGASAVYPIEEPMAAAIGAGLPTADPVASTVVDIGGGTTEVAVISLGSMVVWRSLPVGGYEMDDAIVGHVRRLHSLEIGEGRAEQLKIEIGSAWALPEESEGEANGRDLRTGLLRRVVLSAQEARQALETPVMQVIDAVRETLEQTPPELSADISERGIVLAGGGVLLRGFPERLQAETGLPVHLAEQPLTCVALGAGRCLDELEAIARCPPTRGSWADVEARDDGPTLHR